MVFHPIITECLDMMVSHLKFFGGSGISDLAFDIFQPFNYITDPLLAGDYYMPTEPIDRDNISNNISELAENGNYTGITAYSIDGDPLDTVTYSIDNQINPIFSIDPNTNSINVLDNSFLDYEQNPSHTITVKANSTDGTFSSKNFIINLTDQNEPLEITSPLIAYIDENMSADTVVYDVNAIDPEE